MRCCGAKTLASVAVLAVAVLWGACYNAMGRVTAAYEPFPTPDELAARTLGGQYFRERPSDGGSLEYHIYGSGHANARVWLFVHGAVSTGGVLRIFPDFHEKMKALNVRVIAPTMAGWGASDAYGPLFDITSAQWLERWGQDVMALMNHLNLDRFAVSGMSLGGTPAIAVAAAAHKEKRLTALAPLIALMWSHPGFDLATVGEYSLGSRLGMAALYNPYLGSLAAELMRKMVMNTNDEGWKTNPMLPPDVAWDRVAWGWDMQHSVRYQLHGQVQSNRLPANFDEDPLDWTAFDDDSVPIHIFYGELDDTVTPPVATHVATRLPWAEPHPFNGTHFHLDIFQVAHTLFQ